MLPGTYVTVRNPCARKLLRIFTEVLDVKKETNVLWESAAKYKRKKIRAGSML